MPRQSEAGSRKRRAFIFDWRERVLDSDLPSLAKLVALAVAEDANYSDGTGAHPGNRRLCKRTGLAPGTVVRYLRILVAHGWLKLVREGSYVQRGEERTASEYDCVLPSKSRPCQPSPPRARSKSGKFVPSGGTVASPPRGTVPVTQSTPDDPSTMSADGTLASTGLGRAGTNDDRSTGPRRPFHETSTTIAPGGARQPTKADHADGRPSGAGAPTAAPPVYRASIPADELCDCPHDANVSHRRGDVGCEHE